MPDAPLVSILLPTYNRAHLLPRAVDSVLGQTYPNWELLIWNDGSTDETEAVLHGLNDVRIRCFSDRNRGKAAAVNCAFARSRGDLITFLDDDDTWLPDKLKSQIAFLQNDRDVDLIFSNFLNINKDTDIGANGFAQSAAGLGRLQTSSDSPDYKRIRKGWLEGIAVDNFIAMDTIIMRRSLIEVVGGFNEKLACSEDFELWWRLGLAGVRAAYTDEVLLIRNKYPGSLSGSGIRTLAGTLPMLDACAEASKQANREETIRYLRPAYRNVWQNLTAEYGREGELSRAFQAFSNSLRYGLRPGSFKALFGALITRPVRRKS